MIMDPRGDVTAALPTKRPLSGAQRMRASRQRKRQGIRVVLVDLRATEIEGLISHGLLDPAMRNDREAIGGALGKLLDRIPPGKWPTLVRR
jgi:hypothetical protein